MIAVFPDHTHLLLDLLYCWIRQHERLVEAFEHIIYVYISTESSCAGPKFYESKNSF